MNELQEKILSEVDKAGGSISWVNLMIPLSHREQQSAMENVRVLEAEKILNRHVRRDDSTGKMIFTVDRVNQAESVDKGGQ